MTMLSEDGRRTLTAIAERHGVSLGAAEHLLGALMAGHATQAQFNHPDLGGMGQWSQGGMIMVGDMFNTGLQARVSGLCSELAGLVRDMATTASSSPYQSQSQSSSSNGHSSACATGGVSLFVPGAFTSGNWWPDGLGHAASTGAQNNLRYAFFPSSQRLAIDIAGKITVYDTRDHQIGGFSQQQSGDQSLSFTSQYGLVRVADLAVVPQPPTGTPPAETAMPEPFVAAPQPPAPQPPAPQPTVSQPVEPQPETLQAARTLSSPAQNGIAAAEDDIFDKIERLAGLHARGILTEQEFETKKKELLARI